MDIMKESLEQLERFVCRYYHAPLKTVAKQFGYATTKEEMLRSLAEKDSKIEVLCMYEYGLILTSNEPHRGTYLLAPCENPDGPFMGIWVNGYYTVLYSCDTLLEFLECSLAHKPAYGYMEGIPEARPQPGNVLYSAKDTHCCQKRAENCKERLNYCPYCGAANPKTEGGE